MSTPAKRRAIARAISAKKASSVGGYGAYRRRAPAPAKRTYVRKAVVRGRGAYKKDYGQRLGAVIGEGVQEGLSQLIPFLSKAVTGFGDYAPTPFAKGIKSNTLSMGLDPPDVVNTKMKNVIIRHREYLGDVVTGSVAGVFTLNSYTINPGLPECFPWLSQVATSFQQYKLRGMLFEFKSTSADALNSTNTALGTVIMATQYDSTEPDFTTKAAMENHEYSSSARQSSSMLHPIECARSENVLSELYVRNGSETGTSDPRFMDFGKFQIATVGQQGSSVNIGELWVSYEIELLKPCLQNPGGASSLLQTGHLRCLSGATATNPFGTNPSILGNLGLSVGGANKNVVTLPDSLSPGQQFFMFFGVVCTGGAAAIVTPTITYSPGLTPVQIFNGDASATYTNNGTTSPALMMCASFLVTSSVSPLTITLSGGTYPSVGTVTSDLWITSQVAGYGADIPSSPEEKLEEVVEQLRQRVKQLEGATAEGFESDSDDPQQELQQLRQLMTQMKSKFSSVEEKLFTPPPKK